MADPDDRLNDSLKALLQIEHGRRVLFWLLEECAVYAEGFTGEDAATNYTLGRQSVGRRLISRLDGIDPRLYPQLLLAIADMRDFEKAASAADQSESDNDE